MIGHIRDLLEEGGTHTFTVAHIQDLPEFGSDLDFAAVAVKIDNNLYVDNVVLLDGKVAAGDEIEVRSPNHDEEGGFPRVTLAK